MTTGVHRRRDRTAVEPDNQGRGAAGYRAAPLPVGYSPAAGSDTDATWGHAVVTCAVAPGQPPNHEPARS